MVQRVIQVSRPPLAAAIALLLCAKLASAATGPDSATAAQAAPPPAHVDARQLAISESVLRYCTRVEAAGTGPLTRKHEALVHGLSKPELLLARQSAEYRAAFAAEDAFLANVDEHNVHRICGGPPMKRRDTPPSATPPAR